MEGQSLKPQCPKWLTNNEKPQAGQLSHIRMWNRDKWYWCSKETGGKCEGCWVHHPPASCKGKAFKGFNKKGMSKDSPKPEKVEKTSKRKEETDDEKKKGSTSDLLQLSPLLTMRLTIPVIMMNEDGGGKVIVQPTYLS